MRIHNFKRSIILVTCFLLLFKLFFLTPSLGWAQVEPDSPPLRTLPLNLLANDLLNILRKAVRAADFLLENENFFIAPTENYKQIEITAIGKVYKAPLGLFSTIEERKHLTITVREISPGVFRFFVDIKVERFWPLRGYWTEWNYRVKTSQIRVHFAELLNEILEPYKKNK